MTPTNLTTSGTNAAAEFVAANAARRARRAQHTQEFGTRVDRHIASNRERMQEDAAAFSSLQQQFQGLQRQNEGVQQRALALGNGIDILNAANQVGVDEELFAQIYRDLEVLDQRVTTMTVQAENHFQSGVAEINSGFERNAELSRHLEEQETNGNRILEGEMASLLQQIIDLQENNQELHETLNGIGESFQDLENKAKVDDDLIDLLTSREYYQQELELLAEMLKQQPDPALDLLLVFYGQMQEGFVVDRDRNLSVVDQLQSVQTQIQENSLDALTLQFDQLENACHVLEEQIDALPPAIDQIRTMQVQLKKEIKMVKKLLKQQRKAMLDGFIKTMTLLGTAVLTGGASAWIQLGMNVTGLDEKLNQVTAKIMKPLTQPLMKFLKPVMAPLNKVLAPLNKKIAPAIQILKYVNAIQGAAEVLNNGGTWEQAGMSIVDNVAPKSLGPEQLFNNLCSYPLQIFKQEVLKSAAPALETIQNFTSVINSAKSLANAVQTAAASINFSNTAPSNTACRGGFIDDIYRTRRQEVAAQQARPAPALKATAKNETAVNVPANKQIPATTRNTNTQGNNQPRTIPPAARPPINGEQQKSSEQRKIVQGDVQGESKKPTTPQKQSQPNLQQGPVKPKSGQLTNSKIKDAPSSSSASQSTRLSSDPQVHSVTANLGNLRFALKKAKEMEASGTLPLNGVVTALTIDEMHKAINVRMKSPDMPDSTTWGYTKSIYNQAVDQAVKNSGIDSIPDLYEPLNSPELPKPLTILKKGAPHTEELSIVQGGLEGGIAGYHAHKGRCERFDASIEAYKQMESESLATITYVNK